MSQSHVSHPRESITGYRKTILLSFAQKVISPPRIVKFIETESRMVVARDWRRREWRVSVLWGEGVLERDGALVTQ